MKYFDVFNGDADGICALHQLRLAAPRESVLVTGVKRDIALLARVQAKQGDHVTVLDVSLDSNRNALLDLLKKGVEIDYFDHHFAGELPQHPKLKARIDSAPEVCTSILVDRALDGEHRLWAIVAAFGDNLPHVAHSLARTCKLEPEQLQELRELGESINYNAYGDSVAELFIHPIKLYEALRPYKNPLDFITSEPVLRTLCDGRRQDMEMALQVETQTELPGGTLYILPNRSWAQRVRGVFSNHLTTSSPDRAHAVLCKLAENGYMVSVRAPLNAPRGADQLCRQFASGGGRAAAGGINHLPEEQLQAFIRAFVEAYPAQV